jgi:pyruvate dehydrogenase E2 component (dihydrolipoamide acetyltransferase)
MSTYEFKLPDIGEGVTEGEIVKWLVAQGERVAEDQPMVEVMTDKATVTITSPKAGTIKELRGGVGAVVPVHSVLVVFDLGGGSSAAQAHAPAPAHGGGNGSAKKDEGPAATAVGDIKEDLPGMGVLSPAPRAAAASSSGGLQTYFNEKPLATPATRKLARDLGVDLRTVEPSGPHGRVTKDDVQRGKLGGRGHGQELGIVPGAGTNGAPQQQLQQSFDASAAPRTAQQPTRIAASVPSSHPEDERIPLRGVRKRIFEGMTRSKHTAAHFTFVEECDATRLKEVRDRLKPAAEKQGVKLTFLPFVAKAVVAALKRHPTLNAAFDESSSEIVVRRTYNLGIAASTDAGLMVPVVRDADRKSILDLARDIQRLGEDAKAGKIRSEDLGGSTFTITSLGAQGGLFATPILNFPEVGILGVHQIKQKPVVRDGKIVIGDVMLLSLSFDHRIIDGHVGAAFAYEIIAFLEDPDRLFLAI